MLIFRFSLLPCHMSLCLLRSLCSAELLWRIKSATTPFLFLGKSCCCCCCHVFFLSLSQACFTIQGWIEALQAMHPLDICEHFKSAAIVWGMPFFCLWSIRIVIRPYGVPTPAAPSRFVVVSTITHHRGDRECSTSRQVGARQNSQQPAAATTTRSSVCAVSNLSLTQKVASKPNLCCLTRQDMFPGNVLHSLHRCGFFETS